MSGQALGLVRQQPGAGGDYQHVVAERGPVAEVHLISGQVDVVYADLAEADTRVQLPVPRPDKPFGLGQPERDEQQPGLVDMIVVLVDHHDLGLTRAIHPPQTVGRDRPARPATENHDTLHIFNLPEAGPGG